MQIDETSVENLDGYPITVKLLHLGDINEEVDSTQPRNGVHRSNLTASDTDHIISEALRTGAPTETVRAKYLIGCDGAHSWVRKQLGFQMVGEVRDNIWGVLGK
jgi:2-polyprenyl-6-methoxyphenol hydroxylase-like FAD-dependent oxidoreductase